MTLAPRAVLVHRRTEMAELIARYATRGNAEFFQRSRGGSLAAVEGRQQSQQGALHDAMTAVPRSWRTVTVERSDLSRFLFEPEDVVVVVGQDGLVANVAKYLDGQPVIGIDPEPGRNAGVLVRHPAAALPSLLASAAAGRAVVEHRTMVTARADDGQDLYALNEIYLGHATHQSARYRLLLPDGRTEHQSSSGLLVATGTGATGWTLSVSRDRRQALPPPAPTDAALSWYVREAWPSPATGADLTEGLLTRDQSLTVTVETEALTVFGDGIEDDRLTPTSGQNVVLTVAERRLALVT